MTRSKTSEVVKEALEKHRKKVDRFLKDQERRWPRATADERAQMRREFIALMEEAGQILQLMEADEIAPN